MSVNGSPPSTSTQTSSPPADDRSSRYRRAADAAMERTPRDLANQQARDEQRLRQVRAELAKQERATRGRSRILNDVAAILGGEEPPVANSSEAGGATPEARRPNGDAASPGATPPDPLSPSAPGLQIDGEVPKPKPKTLKDWAAEKEVSLKELEDLALDDGDGEPVTLKEMKKRYAESHDLERRRDDFEDWRTEAQNEVLQARNEIELTVQELAREVAPAAMARASERAKLALEAQVTKGRAQIAEWFPEWSDAQKKAADRDAFAKLMATYGFSRSEVEAVLDARLIKFGIDAMRLMDRYKRLREGERERQPSVQAPAKGKPKEATKTADERARSIAAKGDKIGGVAALLGG